MICMHEVVHLTVMVQKATEARKGLELYKEKYKNAVGGLEDVIQTDVMSSEVTDDAPAPVSDKRRRALKVLRVRPVGWRHNRVSSSNLNLPIIERHTSSSFSVSSQLY